MVLVPGEKVLLTKLGFAWLNAAFVLFIGFTMTPYVG
jgi:hypothetical protein